MPSHSSAREDFAVVHGVKMAEELKALDPFVDELAVPYSQRQHQVRRVDGLHQWRLVQRPKLNELATHPDLNLRMGRARVYVYHDTPRA